MKVLIRPTTPADAPAIATVHVQSWLETYTGLLPPDYLARRTSDAALGQRELSWRQTLEEERQGNVQVAEHAGEVVAFGSIGPARDHPGYDYELLTLYSLRRVQGQGIGRALLESLLREASAAGATNLALLVLDANPTRQWYARQGAREAGEKTDGPLHEIRMVWDHLPEPVQP